MTTVTKKREPINHCRFGRVWQDWYRGYANCQMRVRGNGYCHHHRGVVERTAKP